MDDDALYGHHHLFFCIRNDDISDPRIINNVGIVIGVV